MITIESIRIRDFRGIRDLDLNLDRRNFGICGPNGTGKSGLVDAIEFALTGEISRLSGRGTGDISVKAHGPHVDMRKHPANAMVELTAFIPSLCKSATITRTVAAPADYDLAPNEPRVRQVFEELRIHPEFALSRREIIRYILARPNDRAADVQELLRLSEVEAARKALGGVSNSMQRERDQKQQAHLKEHNALLQILNLDKADAALVLVAINARREILSLPPFDRLEPGTSFKQGVPDSAKATTPALKKSEALADLAVFKRLESEGESEETARKRTAALADIKRLMEDAEDLRALKQQSLVRAGIDLVDGSSCPLCDTEWDRETLLDHLRTKLESAQKATALLAALNSNLNHVIAERDAHSSVLARLCTVCAKLIPKVDNAAIETHAAELDSGTAALRSFVSDSGGIEAAGRTLEQQWWKLPLAAQEQTAACAAGVGALPEASKEDEARDFLTRAEDQYRRAIEARGEFHIAEGRAAVAATALRIFEAHSDAILETLYEEVAADFSEYYRSLNREDEGEFECKLIPSAAKLGFNVDFYGRGRFPPGAYHSEGHQDGMGLCLYLALMKRTLGDNYTFSVLDDVLMSIDAEHRREICRLLKRLFPDTQFILTTHDKVWLKYMQTEGLIANSVTFSGWSVETGPRVVEHQGLWHEIEDALQRDDIDTAAAKLRRHLEHISAILADNLRAEVRFKGDGRYDLDDLLSPSINRWRKKLGDAEKAARSWRRNDDAAALSVRRAQLNNAVERSKAEQWAINPAVHYNQWANFQADEFREVVRAFSDLLGTLQCETCRSFVELQPRHTASEFIRCGCGAISINLKKRVG